MSRPHHLILTVDLEVFGNGSGCVQQCACAPLERMARLVEAYGARLEIFVEAIEFAVMEGDPAHADTVRAVKRQLADMVRRGHQLQIHIHPQWDGAYPDDAKQGWVFKGGTWRTGDTDPDRLVHLLHMSNAWIREAVQEVHEDYGCSVFRAGGWCIQPSEEVVPVLRSMGLNIDSSVAPGLANDDPDTWYDFRSSPEKPWWRVDAEVDRPGSGDFIEVPIAAPRVNAARHLRARVARRREGEFAPGCVGTYSGRKGGMQGISRIWKKARDARRAMLDYCTLPADLMIDGIQEWIGRFGEVDGPIPVVAIGHTKNFSESAERELEKLLVWVSEQDSLRIDSYRGWYETVIGKSATVSGPAKQRQDGESLRGRM